MAHYLDDFLFIGEARSEGCAQLMRMFIEACEDLGPSWPMTRVRVWQKSSTFWLLSWMPGHSVAGFPGRRSIRSGVVTICPYG